MTRGHFLYVEKPHALHSRIYRSWAVFDGGLQAPEKFHATRRHRRLVATSPSGVFLVKILASLLHRIPTMTALSLQRFVAAQDVCLNEAMAELKAGKKLSHWIWFVFPQHKALGHSNTAIHYGIADPEEARQYLRHPTLGPRLKKCVQLVLLNPQRTPYAIFGNPDDMKFRSCLTLFMKAAPEEPIFAKALDTFYGGKPDELTLGFLD